jgi:hypothetical protein
MNCTGKREELLLERVRVDPRAARLIEKGKGVGHAAFLIFPITR